MVRRESRTGAVRLGSACVEPGEKAWGQLQIARGGKTVRLPVAVVCGAEPGEHVVMLACQHGIEINGAAAIRRFVEQVDPRRISGTVFAIPCANPRAAMLGASSWPERWHAQLVRRFKDGPYRVPRGKYSGPYYERYKMNQVWPGRKDGTLVERMVHEIWNKAVLAPHRKASLVVDLHCHQYATAVYAQNDADVDLGIAAGVRFIVNQRSAGDPRKPRYICNVCRNAGIRALVIELAGQGAIWPEAVEDGRIALFNLLKFKRMLLGKPSLPPVTYVLDPWRSMFEKTRRCTARIVKASHSGLVIRRKRHYDIVKKGELVCEVMDPYTGAIVQAARAPRSGCLYSITMSGICGKGDILFTVSVFRCIEPARHLAMLAGRASAS